ncbi:MAG: rod shape-determining protein MreC [Selenomonadaceae bacterium]|nr:rod shape-determining protein MreC [Selenomonadaceae bacterium]
MSNKVHKEKTTGKKIIALIVVFISVFCCVFFAARGKFATPGTDNTAMTIMSPFQRAFAWVGSQLAFVKGTVAEISHLHEQNKQLREEVEILRAQNLTATEYASENQRLRNLLGYKQSAVQFDLVAASVIGRESASWSSVIVINRGTLDGVANNMPVVTELGLVGHVMEADFNSAKVQLLIDPRSSVGTLIQRPESRVAGIVEGDIKNPGRPRMVNIPKDADVQINDMIITSGFGGVYPKGLVVGKCIAVHNEEGGLLKFCEVETAVNFQKLEDVAVIVASREAPPEPIQPPTQTPGTETDPYETAERLQAAKQQILDAQQQVLDAQRQQLQQAREQAGQPIQTTQPVEQPIDQPVETSQPVEQSSDKNSYDTSNTRQDDYQSREQSDQTSGRSAR